MRSLIAALALLAAAPALAQESAAPIPRAPDGRPDLHGYWFSGFLTPLQRPKGVTELVVPPEAQAALIEKLIADQSEGEVYDPEFDSNPVPRALLEVNGDLRSSWLIEPADGKLPLTALAKAALDRDGPEFDDPENRPVPERCIDGLVNAPMSASSLMIPMQIVQTPDTVVISMEDMEPLRIVSLTDPPQHDALRSRGGQSRGRWEDDTFVVETDSLSISDPAGLTWRGGAFVTSDSRVIERFRLLSADLLLYRFTIEDASLYKAPWLAEYVLKRIASPVYEYACHEGNYAMVNIMTAARLGRQEKPDKKN
ncbi:MAG: hypothetical protein Q8R82_07345 [Hyphomonadaceae bacterium]|nr:hypothetical protein [Hyphomonadaceae bacterium]